MGLSMAAPTRTRLVIAGDDARYRERLAAAIGHVMNRFDEDGRLNDPNLEEEMREIIRDLLAEIDEPIAGTRHTRRRLISVPAASEKEVEG